MSQRTLTRMSWAVDCLDSDAGVRVRPRGCVPTSVRRFCDSIDKKSLSVEVAYAAVRDFCRSHDL